MKTDTIFLDQKFERRPSVARVIVVVRHVRRFSRLFFAAVCVFVCRVCRAHFT